MGDSFQSLVLPETRPINASTIAAQMLGWLIAKGIGTDAGSSDETSKPDLGPGPRAEEILATMVTGWRDVAFTPIRVDAGRLTTAAMQDGLGPVVCPACESPMGTADDLPPSFMRAVEEWQSGQEGVLACPACGTATPITKWRTEPYWAFGNVTITFWNWPPIKDSFAREVELAAGEPVKVVRGKL